MLRRVAQKGGRQAAASSAAPGSAAGSDPSRLLDGKVALITGGAAGLGLETARLFAEHGARVVTTDIADEAGEAAAAALREQGFEVSYVHADVRSRGQVDAAVAAAEARYGRLDIVIANAGILGRASFRPSEEVTDEDWLDVIEVNLSGAFRTFRAAIPALRRARGGALSATSSIAGRYATLYRVAYSASKGGLEAMVRALAVELAPDDIRVNAVAAGGMATAIHASLGRTPEEITVKRPDVRSAKARMLKEGRDRTRDIASIQLFLCSELGAYINGETIVADGGFSIWNGT
jgi:NAD(P)-dependent dehydrogenase (short-subunit alcohol dehydrogenase family)